MIQKQKNLSEWKIDYLSWSGFHIHRRDEPHIFVDPPKGTTFPNDKKIIIFITHGHPEHLGGTLDHIRARSAHDETAIIASKKIGTYLNRECRRDKVDFLKVAPGQNIILAPEINFDVFEWQHMPLLPPGIGAALRHIWHMLKGYQQAWRIIKMSLFGPKTAGKMLGFILRLPENKNIIIFGEGLHRKSRIAEVSAIGHRAVGSTLLVASEPEDSAQLPELILASGASEAILYEPHRPWRDIFCLPHVNLAALQKAAINAGVQTKIARLEKDRVPKG